MLHMLRRYWDSVAVSLHVKPQAHPLTRRESLWTVGLLFAFVAVRALVNAPSLAIAKWYATQFGEGARVLLGEPLIKGDIAGNFAQARALIEPTYRAYDELFRIFPLIGVNWDVPHGHPRLPTEIPLFIPIALMDYSSPIFQAFAYALPVLAMAALAWSLRLLDIPVVGAWLVTAVLVVSPIGPWALESTYPFVALAVAVSWRYRNRPVIAALGIVVAGAGRGLALLPALYFAAAKSWKTLVWLGTMLVILLGIAVALEPTVVGDFLNRGLAWGQENAGRPDNASLAAALIRPTYSYVAAAVIFILAARRGSFLFWALVWLSAALAPIAWTYAATALFPLGAFLWNKGNVARVCVSIAAVLLVANGSYAGLNYGAIVLLLGVGLVAAGWRSEKSGQAALETNVYTRS